MYGRVDFVVIIVAVVVVAVAFVLVVVVVVLRWLLISFGVSGRPRASLWAPFRCRFGLLLLLGRSGVVVGRPGVSLGVLG